MSQPDSYVRPTSLVPRDTRLSPASLYLMHLLSCALRGQAPAALPSGATWEAVFKLATHNSVATTCAFAVAMAPGASEEECKRLQAEVDRNLMRHAVFDMERESLFAAMDEAGLAHLPLKGVVTSRQYPRPDMRWMCDNDILFGHANADGTVATATEEDARKLRGIMKDAGYKSVHFGEGNHDAYEKAPFLNIEMHRGLAHPEVSWWRYYENPWERARKDEDAAGLSYAFSREDAYLFHVAHMFKHFSVSGCGVRGIADEWVLTQAWGTTMDRAYLDGELAKLGMLEFERDLSRTAASVIGEDACGQALTGGASGTASQAEATAAEAGVPANMTGTTAASTPARKPDAAAATTPSVEKAEPTTLSVKDTAMLAYMLGSGTYGTIANHVTLELAREEAERGKKGLRTRYLLRRAFPSPKELRLWYPVLKKAPWLLPGVYVYRLATKPFTRTGRLRAELKTVAKTTKQTKR